MSRKGYYEKEKQYLNGRFKINVIWRHILNIDWASKMVLVVKNLPANTGDLRDAYLICGMGRSPGGGHGNPSSILDWKVPMDRGTWCATIHSVAESETT